MTITLLDEVKKMNDRIKELEAALTEARKLLVRVKMYVPDSQHELHARIHRATEQ